MQTKTDNTVAEIMAEDNAAVDNLAAGNVATITNPAIDSVPQELAYNGIDRNAWVFGFNPQQELWNGRLAMIGFVAYLLWDMGGYSVLRDVLHFLP